MNVRLPLILIGFVLVALIALLVSSCRDTFDPSERLLQLDGADAEAAVKDVDTVEMVRTEPTQQKLVFARTAPDKWELTEPAGAKIDGFAVGSLVRELVRLKPTPFAELSGNLTTFGLDKPSVKITLRQGSAKSATLNIGQTTIGKDKAVTFVTTDHRPDTPLAVRRQDLDGVFRPGTGEGSAWQVARWLPDFRQRRVLGADVRDPLTDLTTVTLSQADKSVSLKRADSGDWLFAAPANYGQADVPGSPEVVADTFTGVRPLLTALTGLQVTDPADFIENPGPLDQYGLNPGNPAMIRVELTPKAGKPEVLFLGKKVDEKAVPSKVFARRDGDSAVMRLTTDRLPALTKLVADPTELRDRTLVSDQKRESIDALDVTAGGTSFKLRKVSVGAAQQWVLYGGPNDPQIAGQAVAPLIQALTQPRVAKEVMTGPYDAAFVPAERKAEIKLWFDAVDPPATPGEPGKLPPEPKLKGDGQPAVTLLFGQATADTAFVRRTIDKVAVDLKVPTGVLTAANRGRLEYLSLALKSFPTNTANRVSFTRNGEPFELTRDDAPDPVYPTGKWTYAKPDRLKGQIADASTVVTALLAPLATQAAMRVVSEAPTPEELTKFGLAPAKQTVTVGLTGEPKELKYEYGNETDDRQGVYAREVGRAAVFTVPAGMTAGFAGADLRNRILYSLDRGAITKIVMKGWKKELKAPAEVVLEKGPTGWTATGLPSPLTVDPTKMEMLLSQITAPRAEVFLGPALKPEHGFNMEADPNTLLVRVFVGPREAAVLNIGNEANNGLSYYVWCSVPNEVLTLPVAVLRVFKEKPTGLQK